MYMEYEVFLKMLRKAIQEEDIMIELDVDNCFGSLRVGFDLKMYNYNEDKYDLLLRLSKTVEILD